MAVNKPMPVSTEITQGASVTPTQVVAGESLAKDLQGVMGAANIMNTTDKQATVKLAKRQAADSRNQLAMELTAIESQVTPETDERETQSQINAAYLKHNNNENLRYDARQAFEDEYTSPMAVSTGKMNARLEIKYRERMSTDAQNYASMTINNDIALGKQQTSEDRTEFTEQYTMYGYKTAADADKAFADIINVGFQTEQAAGIGRILNSVDYDVEKGLSAENADQIFNDRYSAFGKMDGMLIQWDENVDPDAKKAILKTWDNFNRSLDSINSDAPNTAYAVSLSTTNDLVSKAKSGEFSLNQIQANGETMKKEYSALNEPSALPLSKSQKESYEKSIELNKLEADKMTYAQNIVSTDKQQTHTLLQSGGTIEIDEKTYKVTSEYMKNIVEGEFARISDTMKTSAVDSPEFASAVTSSLNLTQRTGVRNKAIVAMSDSITGDGIFVSLDDVRKSTYVSGALNNTGTSNDLLENTMFVAISQKHLAQFDAGTATEAETVLKINNELRAAKNGVFGQIQNGKFKTAFSNALELSADDWVDTTIETATQNALMLRWAAQGGTYNTDKKSLKKWIDNNTVIVGGTGRAVANSFGDFFWGGSDKSTSAMTLKNSDGQYLSAGVYEDSISNIVDDYNETNPSNQIATNDLRVTSGFKGGKDANEGYWSINLLQDGVSINLGDFTGQDLTMKSNSNQIDQNTDSNATKTDGVTKITLKPTKFKNEPLESRIKRFQRSVGATADGQIGKNTMSAFLSGFETEEEAVAAWDETFLGKDASERTAENNYVLTKSQQNVLSDMQTEFPELVATSGYRNPIQNAKASTANMFDKGATVDSAQKIYSKKYDPIIKNYYDAKSKGDEAGMAKYRKQAFNLIAASGGSHTTGSGMDLRSKNLSTDRKNEVIASLNKKGYSAVLENKGKDNEHIHIEGTADKY